MYSNDAFVIQRVDNDCDDFVSKVVVIAIFPLGYGRTWCHWKLALLDVLKRVVANPIVFVGTHDVLSLVRSILNSIGHSVFVSRFRGGILQA